MYDGVPSNCPVPRRRLAGLAFSLWQAAPPADPRGKPRSMGTAAAGAVPPRMTGPGQRNGLTNTGSKHSLAETQEPYGAYSRQSAARTEAITWSPPMIHRKLVRVCSGALLAAVVYGCGDNTPDVGPSAGLLAVTPLFAGVDQGTTQQLSASLNGTVVPVTWATSDATVATVSANGVVTGVAPGKVAITATMVDDPTRTRSASITVLAVLGTRLTSGVAVTNVSSGTLARDQGLLYNIAVPAGATSLTVTFTGGTGDGDIFVQRQVPPDASGNETGCHSYNGGNAESCTVSNPA